MKIFIILACVPLYMANSFCDKFVSSKGGNKYNFLYNCIKFLIAALCTLPLFLCDSAPKFKMGAILCGISCGVMYAISKMIILKGYEMTSVTFMTLCHSAGMILPCVIGHFFWSETMSVLSLVGILLAVTSIVLLKDSKSDKKSFDLMGILIGIVVFLTSGGIMVIQKLLGLYFAEQSVGAYNFYSFVAAFLILSFFISPNKNGGATQNAVLLPKKEHKKDMQVVVPCAAGSAVSLCVISFVMTSLAGSVPSTILFPLFNGSGIICVCIGSVFLFKEKLTIKKIIGLILGLCGLFLVNF